MAGLKWVVVDCAHQIEWNCEVTDTLSLVSSLCVMNRRRKSKDGLEKEEVKKRWACDLGTD